MIVLMCQAKQHGALRVGLMLCSCNEKWVGGNRAVTASTRPPPNITLHTDALQYTIVHETLHSSSSVVCTSVSSMGRCVVYNNMHLLLTYLILFFCA